MGPKQVALELGCANRCRRLKEGRMNSLVHSLLVGLNSLLSPIVDKNRLIRRSNGRCTTL
ncbi:hypothetical protein I79_013953 [Cricetulus griseus]|uniref:Uncharacterized protein n=1 Tax=Cricetulus griseus TaxID=10029 RepID=G3HSV5_CRIGR|nr:hypothetical protein I79_013953 [Cricetulus griseus]